MMSFSIRSALLTRNFAPGRDASHPVDLIVIHVTQGDAASVVSWFNNPASKVSSHYLVRADGKILQFVAEDDTAWHAGRVDHPTAQLVIDRAPANPNGYSISIEHEGDGHHELTALQRLASIALLADICRRRGIPVDRDHIVGHHEIYSLKACPGAISVDRLVAATAAYHDMPSAHSHDERPRVVWSPQLNDYLVVTQYVDDAEWYYVPLSELSTMKGERAGTALSHMPLTPAI